ncbi:cryptochrome/photolyase family protein [Pseudooceanicola sp. CBS1P-1]|uniref:Cryptochrome/photolyase family protein n=1 Tax=Pseudooceanicola albus TaxID=2692189 RepID=A0A6L7G8U6_9RHOB|nr:MULTISPECIES: cryptochrome/photolyase family protein [Pseudooceanicola]MBT9386453.1 cryptochrome/photolyase family protein [Pseudooceanicola endophyticus]MXN20389.1 cryptochrome/photolyase family protein [Pseudooceanicola albus]
MSLVLVLGDQLSPALSALRAADRQSDRVVMAEVASETGYVPHHPKKIALVLAAMRKFAARLRAEGWTVDYTRLDDPENSGSIPGELLRRAADSGEARVLATRPGEWRLIAALEEAPLDVTLLPDDRFIASLAEFDAWAEGRKQLRMEYFYREMRRKSGLLMEGDQPAGGRWNYDSENRKPARDDLFAPRPLWFDPDPVVAEVLDLVEARFGANFGQLRPFGYATDETQARQVLEHFITRALPMFGDYQDAMLSGNRFLYHSLLSPCLNLGLLDPLEVCRRAEAAWKAGQAPLNAVEGFIRQILGWREYVRGLYFREGPDYATRNGLGHERALPPLYWGAPTRMNCLSHAVAQTGEEAYAHHIQRLMVTGNFALLAGIDPAQVHEWYLSVYIDAFEWVEAPNTVGMSQFADGGLIASKPYVSSGAYIDRMSDYCGGCGYDVKVKAGQGACPFNLLYWDFLARHRDRFAGNPRMGQMYRTWDRMEEVHRKAVRAGAAEFLEQLDAGVPV